MKVESRGIRQARKHAKRALETPTGIDIYFPSERYVRTTELIHIGRAILGVNKMLEKSSNSLRIASVSPETRMEHNEWLFTTSGDAMLTVVEDVLSRDPLNPELYLFAGNHFLTYTPQDPYEIRNTPAFRNIIALLSFANLSLLQPDSSEARDGMGRALSLITSTEEVDGLGNKTLERLIEGEVLMKDGNFAKAISVFKRVPADSAHAWLAYQKTADALLRIGETEAAADTATNAAQMLIEKRDYQSALALCEFATEVRPEPTSLLLLGEAYHAIGLQNQAAGFADEATILFENAEKAFLQATEVVPQSYIAQQNQVKAMFRRRELEWQKGHRLWSERNFSDAEVAFRRSTDFYHEAIAMEQHARKNRMS